MRSLCAALLPNAGHAHRDPLFPSKVGMPPGTPDAYKRARLRDPTKEGEAVSSRGVVVIGTGAGGFCWASSMVCASATAERWGVVNSEKNGNRRVLRHEG